MEEIFFEKFRTFIPIRFSIPTEAPASISAEQARVRCWGQFDFVRDRSLARAG